MKLVSLLILVFGAQASIASVEPNADSLQCFTKSSCFERILNCKHFDPGGQNWDAHGFYRINRTNICVTSTGKTIEISSQGEVTEVTSRISSNDVDSVVESCQKRLETIAKTYPTCS